MGIGPGRHCFSFAYLKLKLFRFLNQDSGLQPIL